MKYFLWLVLVFSIIAGCWLAHDLYSNVMDRKEVKEDYAEINRVNYELFNVQLWKEEALDIVQRRIRAFKLSEETYGVLEVQINEYLKKLYDQYIKSGALVEIILSEAEKSGSINKMFLELIRTNINQQLENIDLSDQLPLFANQIVGEIRESEPFLRSYMQAELLRLVMDDASKVAIDRRSLIYRKYGFQTLDETHEFLEGEEWCLSAVIKKNMLILGVLLAFIIFLTLISSAYIGFQGQVIALSGVSIILLLLGVSMPMIDIDARLESFSFLLMNEPISFDEQIIYFQSKSILEVTKTLIQGEGIDLKIVGFLVFTFSIIFPFTKLILSALYLFVQRLQNSPLVQAIIFHLGKWSMADVFVVALFMAYIGFYGIITSQLDSISSNRSGFVIETINYSRLSPGAFFFTSYTVLSIFIGIMINKKS